MKTISHELLEATWEETNELDATEGKNLNARLGTQQQPLLAYLLVTEDRIGHPDLVQGGLMMPGIVLWLATERVLGHELPPIAPETLEQADGRNFRTLEDLDEGPEMTMEDRVSRLLEAYDQTPALFWTLQYLVDVCEEEPGSFSEACSEAWLSLKTVLDAIVATADGTATAGSASQ